MARKGYGGASRKSVSSNIRESEKSGAVAKTRQSKGNAAAQKQAVAIGISKAKQNAGKGRGGKRGR